MNNLHKKNAGALIVISNGKSTKANGHLSRAEEQMKLSGVETVVFAEVQPNPLKSTVMVGTSFANENRCDFIVALGGGSCIDAAKAIAVGDYWDYVSAGSGKGQSMKHKPLPLVAITTTAGTGSEIDPWAVVTANAKSLNIR